MAGRGTDIADGYKVQGILESCFESESLAAVHRESTGQR